MISLKVSLAAHGPMSMRVIYGRSSHHKIEALFKAFARALRVACSRDRRLGRMLPSTRDFCDCHCGLRRGQPQFGEEGILDHLGAQVVVTDQPELVARSGQDCLARGRTLLSARSFVSNRLARSFAGRRFRPETISRNLSGNAMVFRKGSEECSAIPGAGIFPGKMPAVSVVRKVAACRLEFTDRAARVTLAARHCAGLIRVLD